MASGGYGGDVLDGGTEDDKLVGSAGDDAVYGDGSDELGGKGDADTLFGGDGRVVMSGNEAVETVYGDGGNDKLFAGSGNDVPYGGDDALPPDEEDMDFIILIGEGGLAVRRCRRRYGDDGDDATLSSGGGNDVIYGGVGNDTLGTALQGPSSDELEFGHDTLCGDAGDGGILADVGADLIYGGDGTDRFVYRSIDDSNAAMRDTIADFEDGVDLLDFSAFDADTDADPPSFVPAAGSGVLVGEVSAVQIGGDVVVYVRNGSGITGEILLRDAALGDRFHLRLTSGPSSAIPARVNACR
jgi:Ca2+-binding RTX toxin-like protein